MSEKHCKTCATVNTIQGSLHTSAKSMRGHVSYWDEKKKEARAHIAIFGPMTFFLTLNPAERHWVEVIDLYQKVTSININNHYVDMTMENFSNGKCH